MSEMLLQTKLCPPRLADDPILRPNLFQLLDSGQNDVLTLVSAPPGYGKSVLLASWLEDRRLPHAWVSLDESDNDPESFFQYFIAALQRQHSHVCKKLHGILPHAPQSDPVFLARYFTEELTACGKPVLLVLDDFHLVRNQDVVEFLSELVKNPPPLLRLVILTRRDPPLPLNLLRSQGNLTEIRMQDLRFTAEETASFLKREARGSLSEQAVQNLDKWLEGWVAGLRLVSLNLRYCEDMDRFLEKLAGSPQAIREYLMNEVLEQQSPSFRGCLLKISVLNRFCAASLKALCATPVPEGLISCAQEDCARENSPDSSPSVVGIPLLSWLLESNLFLISLDDEGTWYRFHHLFRDFLLERLTDLAGEATVTVLHNSAGNWFAGQNLLEEAVNHYLKGTDPDKAVKLVVDNRHALVQQERDVRLNHLINLLPAAKVTGEPGLLLHRAWMRLEFLELGSNSNLDRAEDLIGKMPADQAETRRLMGEVHAIRSMLHYEATQAKEARHHVDRALELLGEDQLAERGVAMIMLACSLQMEGRMEEALAVVFDAFEQPKFLETALHTRLLMALSFMYWLEADLEGMKPVLDELGSLGRKLNFPETIAHALYLQGIIHYEHNEIDEAETLLLQVIEEYPETNLKNTVHSAYALTLCYEAQQRPEEARKLTKKIIRRAVQLRNKHMLKTAEGFQAELNLRQGKVAEASRWAEGFHRDAHRASYRFYVPHITEAKTYLHEHHNSSLEKARELLSQLEEVSTLTHNKKVLIQVLALKALCLERLGDSGAALQALGRAVQLAQPGGFIRSFVDAGPELVPLLNQLDLDKRGVEYMGRILAGFAGLQDRALQKTSFSRVETAPVAIDDPLVDPLTERELEVLGLLSIRLSNREIAERLFIAPGTVKRHTNTIYTKLNVHSRGDAVAKARGLGFLKSQ